MVNPTPIPIDSISDPAQIRVKLLASGNEVHAPLSAISNAFKAIFDLIYQPLAATLTSWAGITRAAGFDTFTATPSSANLRAMLTDETGTGPAYFANGALGTPSSGTLTNCTGLPNASVVGLGTAALKNTGTSGNTVPLLDGANTWSASQSSSLNPATGPVLNVGGNLQTIASGTELVLSNNSGLLVISDTTNGATGVIAMGGGTITVISNAGQYVNTNSPTTSQIGIYFNVSPAQYRIKNGFAVSRDFGILWLSSRNSV